MDRQKDFSFKRKDAEQSSGGVLAMSVIRSGNQDERSVCFNRENFIKWHSNIAGVSRQISTLDLPTLYRKWRKRKSESKEVMYQEKPKSSVKERKRHLRKISVHNGTGVLKFMVEAAC